MTNRYDVLVEAIASRDLISLWLAVFVAALLLGWLLVQRYARGRLAFMRTLYAGFVLAVWVASFIYFGMVLPLAG
jgi:hypothetical protein